MEARDDVAHVPVFEGDAEPEADWIRAAWEEHGRRDPRCIGDEARVLRDPEPGLITPEAGAWHVARRDDQREPERDLAIVDRQRADERDPDGRRFAWQQIANTQGERAGALFFRDRRTVA